MTGKHKIWLIPALIIGFNCLAFLLLLGISMNRDRRKPDGMENTVSEDGAEDGSEDRRAEVQDKEASEAGKTKGVSAEGLADSFYEDEAEEDRPLDNGYVLLLTSSESDLKIQIVDTLDSAGNKVSGMRWRARVMRISGDTGTDGETGYEDEFDVEDDDDDGIIYLNEMAPGDYEVIMDNGSGIEEMSSITIKPKMKYTASSGIRSIVLQESDIDASVEDTGSDPEEKESEAELEGEGTKTPEGIALPQGTLGIDVSKYNKDIDWERVRASGIDFAIIRAGYRGSSSGVLVEDPYFRQNLAGAKAAGLRIGVYFFTQAINAQEAAEEAEAVASLVNSSDLELPVFLDVESSGNSSGGRADPLDVAARTEMVRVFCETAESLGYRAGVYANKTWMNKKLDMSVLAPYTKWLAQYRAEGPTYDGDYSIWQYTSSGAVDGITGRVDLDVLVK